MKPLIISLFDFTGVWSEPYVAAGYDVHRFDLRLGHDVRLLERIKRPVHGVLAAPPCTDFASSGSRWWAAKGEAALLAGLATVDAACRFILAHNPSWWALENPVGRLRRYLGDPALIFDPCDYGDPYTKRTLLWGRFNTPAKAPVEPVEGSKMWRLPPSPDRAALRSATPPGFARAFFEANP
jgi:hypothetical protein